MKKKLFKNLIVFSFFLLILTPFLSVQAVDMGINYARDLGLPERDPREAAISIVQLLMTFLGIIAVVIILLGGFKWMTAAGNEDKVAEAKKLIGAGVIGLVIILAAFLIVNFVVVNVTNALNG